MTIKLVALDLDGTIVNEKLEISQRTLKTIRTLLEHTSVRVVLATGRMFASTLPFAERLGIRDPIIAYQGALIRDYATHRKVIQHTTISMPVARQALEYLIAE